MARPAPLRWARRGSYGNPIEPIGKVILLAGRAGRMRAVRAVLAGTWQSDGLKLLYVPDTADIREGDLLVSTGLGQRYPRGYPVATVTSVRHQSGAPFAEIAASPTARVDRASHVLLVQSTDEPLIPVPDPEAANDP